METEVFKSRVLAELESVVEKRLENSSREYWKAMKGADARSVDVLKKSYTIQEEKLKEVLDHIKSYRSTITELSTVVKEASLVRLSLSENKKAPRMVWCLFSYVVGSLFFELSVDRQTIIFPYSYLGLESIEGKGVDYSFENNGIHGDNRDVHIFAKIEEII